MAKLSSIEALGEKAVVHMLELQLAPEVLGGLKASDPFDSDRVREAANLMKRVCNKQSIAGSYAVSSIRDDKIVRVCCGFVSVGDRDAIADLAGAATGSPEDWASRRCFVLDAERVESLTAAGIPRDNRGPGRREREKAAREDDDRGLRWKVRGDG